MNLQSVYKYGFFALICVVIVVLTLKGRTQGDKLYLNTLETKIEVLEGDIQALDALNSNLKSDILILTDSVESLEQETLKLEGKRRAAIKYYEKKLTAINSYTVTDLDSFFTERYGFGSDSTQAGSN